MFHQNNHMYQHKPKYCCLERFQRQHSPTCLNNSCATTFQLSKQNIGYINISKQYYCNYIQAEPSGPCNLSG